MGNISPIGVLNSVFETIHAGQLATKKEEQLKAQRSAEIVDKGITSTFDVLKTDSEKMDLYKNNILEYYMSKVDPQNLGKINLGAHRKFIQDHKYGLEKFFGKDGYKEITNVGNLQKKVDDINKQNNEISKKLSKTTAGQIENRDPEEIYDFAFSPSQFGGARPTKLKELMNIIKDLTDKIDLWSYSKLDEVNRISPLINEKIKKNGII